MAQHWANLDLHLDVDLDGARLGRSLEDALRAAIRDGRLPAGHRGCPSSRCPGRGPGDRPQHGRRRLRPACRRGLAERATGAGTWVTDAAAPPARRARRPPRRGQAAGRGTTCVPACPTCRRSRAASGWPRRAGRWRAAPDHLLTTRTRAAWRRCARRWPGTWRAPGRQRRPGPDRRLRRLPTRSGSPGPDAARTRGARAAPWSPTASRAQRRAHPARRPAACPAAGRRATARCRHHAPLERRGAALLTPAHQFPLGDDAGPGPPQSCSPSGRPAQAR